MEWSEVISKETYELGQSLANRAKMERLQGKEICPSQDHIFRAFELTKPDEVRVCIVGQDPYHTPGQANGLAFSISPNCKLQPSIINIFKELRADLGYEIPTTGDLTKWAKQGILLLNTSLTVYAHEPNSHNKWGWQTFTKAILKSLTKLPQPIIFLLWGSNAQNCLMSLISAPITKEKNYILREETVKKAYILSSHPSPLSSGRNCGGYPPFFGSKPFSNANRILIEWGAEPIEWKL